MSKSALKLLVLSLLIVAYYSSSYKLSLNYNIFILLINIINIELCNNIIKKKS